MGSFIALIFSICVKFSDKFITILLTLLSTSTIFLSLALNAFKAKFDNQVVFNSKINNATILLKP